MASWTGPYLWLFPSPTWGFVIAKCGQDPQPSEGHVVVIVLHMMIATLLIPEKLSDQELMFD